MDARPACPTPLSRLLLAHGVATLAAAVVLVVAPDEIPRTVGITLPREAALLCYLLAAMEAGIAVLSFGARRLRDRQALRVVVASLIVLHAATAGVEMLAFAQGLSAKIWGNVALRVAVVALLLRFCPPASDGTAPAASASV